MWWSQERERNTRPRRLLPSKLQTPCRRFTVTIGLLKPAQMKEKYGEYYDGMLDAPAKHIDINRHMPLSRKWWVFAQIWTQVIGEYWLPWLVEAGVAIENPPGRQRATERVRAWERSRFPRRKAQRLRDGLDTGGRPPGYHRNAGRIPAQTSDHDGAEALTQGSWPRRASDGSIIPPM